MRIFRKTVDYAVADRRLPMHFMDSLLKRKTDNTLASLNMESQYVELARNLRQREDTLYVVAMKVSFFFFVCLFVFGLLLHLHSCN